MSDPGDKNPQGGHLVGLHQLLLLKLGQLLAPFLVGDVCGESLYGGDSPTPIGHLPPLLPNPTLFAVFSTNPVGHPEGTALLESVPDLSLHLGTVFLIGQTPVAQTGFANELAGRVAGQLTATLGKELQAPGLIVLTPVDHPRQVAHQRL